MVLTNFNEMENLLLENCQRGQKARSFYGIKNKEQGRDRKYLLDWGQIVNLVWGEKPELGWFGGIG